LGDSNYLYVVHLDFLIDVKPPKLAQAQNGEGMLANGRLDVGKMLGKASEEDDITSGIECEPHRNRTCNLLIKSQLLCQLS
jgi:hypothetical protein